MKLLSQFSKQDQLIFILAILILLTATVLLINNSIIFGKFQNITLNYKNYYQKDILPSKTSSLNQNKKRKKIVLENKSIKILSPKLVVNITIKNKLSVIDYKWQQVKNAKSYEIEYSADKLFKKILKKQKMTFNKISAAFDLTGTIFWRINAYNNFNNITQTSNIQKIISTLLPPESLIKSSIEMKSDAQNKSKENVTIKWDKRPIGENYKLEIAQNKEFESPRFIIVPNNFADLSLLVNTPFYWRVAVINKSNELISKYSPVYKLELKKKIKINPPQLKYPIHGESFTYNPERKSYMIELQWEKLGVDHYVLEVSRNYRFKNVMIRKNNLKDPEYSFNPAQFLDQTIYWRVRSVKSNIASLWSKGRSIKIIQEKKIDLSNRALNSPRNLDSSTDGLMITSTMRIKGISKGKEFIYPKNQKVKPIDLEWERIRGARNYFVEVTRDTKFSNIVIQKKVWKNNFSFSPKRYMNQTLYWRVRAARNDKTSSWSKVHQMKIKETEGI